MTCIDAVNNVKGETHDVVTNTVVVNGIVVVTTAVLVIVALASVN